MTTADFTQPQREALLNLLALGMYADSLLSLREDEALRASLEALPWNSGEGRTNFFDRAITRASHADTETKADAYLRHCAAAFTTPEAKRLVIEALTSFLQIDGMGEGEAPFLAKLHQALGI